MPKPLVSVLIAAYNHERFIEEMMRSLIAQTYENIELIIIDDGSSDNTYKKMLGLQPECEKKFKRVVFMAQQNCGVSETSRRLLQIAEGEFIYSIASDDVAKPEAIETLVNFMINHDDYVLAVGDNEFIDANSKRIGWNKHSQNANLAQAQYKTFGAYLRHAHRDVDFLSEQFGSYETLVQSNYIPNGYLTRTSVQKKREQHTSVVLDDWFMHLQLAKFGKMKYIDKVLFSYRQHGTNTFKHSDLMQQMAYQTRLYEQKLVHQKGMEHWAEIFDKYAIQCKTKFRLGHFIHYYKQIDLEYNTKILEIFGHKFVVKQKRR